MLGVSPNRAARSSYSTTARVGSGAENRRRRYLPSGYRFAAVVECCDREGRERYPANIERWVNLSAVGDLTAIDPDLADWWNRVSG